MAGHIDVRVKISAPLEVTWRIAAEAENPDASAGTGDRHAPGHEVIAWDPENNRITYRITTAPDHNGHSWSYCAERNTDVANKTAHARRWGNENFAYSYAFWQYTGSAEASEIRCVADFEMTPSAPLSDQQMEVFMERGTRRAMESTARAAEEEARSAGAATGEVAAPTDAAV
ncbi:MAG: hypothetical protein M3Z75_28360 [Actinomycetota bacterium]|nr:hypothetical protein [Actinomycetota bacterium]